MDSKRFRNGLIILLLVIALGALLYTVFGNSSGTVAEEVSIAKVAELVRNGQVSEIKVHNDDILVTEKSQGQLRSRKETGVSFVEMLHNLNVTDEQIAGVNLLVEEPSGWEVYSGVLLGLLPILLIAVFFVFILRQAQGAGNQAFSFGKSRARMFTGDKPTVTFADVAGSDEAKQELEEIVDAAALSNI